MENIIMTREEKLTRAQALFIGRVYFHNYGGFSSEEFINKMDEEFQILKFKPYDGRILGEARLDCPTINLYEDLGCALDSMEFTNSIKKYRSTMLHEMIHKFFIKKDKDGNIISSGLYILVDKNEEFKNYLGTILVNKTLKSFNLFTASLFKPIFALYVPKSGFGIGVNEGYTEWFRANVLKNEENPMYINLTNIFNKIQKKLENKNMNAINVMKTFGNGNYKYIFETLNMPKEIGILFIRILDFLYIKEKEKEMIKKYLENKKLEQELKKARSNEENNDVIRTKLDNIQKFCLSIENLVRKRFGGQISESKISKLLREYLRENKKAEIRILDYINKHFDTYFEKDNIKFEINLKELADLEDDFFEIVKKDIYERKNIKGSINFTFNKKTEIGYGECFNEYTDTDFGKEDIEEKVELKVCNESTSKFFGTLKKYYHDRKNEKYKIHYKSKFKLSLNIISSLNLAINKFLNGIYSLGNKIKFIIKEAIITVISLIFLALIFAVSAGIVTIILWVLVYLIYHLSMPISEYIKNLNNKEIEIELEEDNLENVDIPIEEDTLENVDIPIEEDTLENVDIPIEDENDIEENNIRAEIEEEIKEDKSLVEQFFSNGFSLAKGDEVYVTSFDSAFVNMSYDYDNLVCDSIRVVKDEEVLMEGNLENIYELYQNATFLEANVRIRLGIENSDGTITYIAWLDLQEYIDKMNEESYTLTLDILRN